MAYNGEPKTGLSLHPQSGLGNQFASQIGLARKGFKVFGTPWEVGRVN